MERGVTAAVVPSARRMPHGRRGTFPVSLEHYNRCEELTDAERRELRDLSPKTLRCKRTRGIRRRPSTLWTALVRLDTARAGLHHGDDARFGRAGAHAAAIILQNCADTGRSSSAWTNEDWTQPVRFERRGLLEVARSHGSFPVTGFKRQCGGCAPSPLEIWFQAIQPWSYPAGLRHDVPDRLRNVHRFPGMLWFPKAFGLG